MSAGPRRPPGTAAEPTRLVELREHADARGGLAVVETGTDVPFPIERVYYLYGIPQGAERGGHGHRELRQLMIAVHGRLRVTVDDGYRQASYELDRPGLGLYIGPMIWRRLTHFSPGAVAVVLASAHYDENDYFREYTEFARAVRERPS
ncbi:sugar 3,4-ketoisomerase [Allonocardiopsis opalescens]|uniref:WxcM-like protein n=1 Tax=Allonocardiopsis opalescens TaxID=1144618 RepID=A0A2T0Q9E3_9ACTN|nr:FdtA/QdtA family cupin domain-containing protein [Allonocardiopsis opalescens]PRY00457.1 WxcM-like protein [Allonocardiopsis opalescens]